MQATEQNPKRVVRQVIKITLLVPAPTDQIRAVPEGIKNKNKKNRKRKTEKLFSFIQLLKSRPVKLLCFTPTLCRPLLSKWNHFLPPETDNTWRASEGWQGEVLQQRFLRSSLQRVPFYSWRLAAEEKSSQAPLHIILPFPSVLCQVEAERGFFFPQGSLGYLLLVLRSSVFYGVRVGVGFLS